MKEIQDPGVRKKFEAYPQHVQPTMLHIRQLILDVANEHEDIGDVTETLKWGEPSYLVKGGSTIRLDWKTKDPTRWAVYFNCQTSLVGTIRQLYGDTFQYEGERAVILDLAEEIPTAELKHCFSLGLRYHRIKHLPMLGT